MVTENGLDMRKRKAPSQPPPNAAHLGEGSEGTGEFLGKVGRMLRERLDTPDGEADRAALEEMAAAIVANERLSLMVFVRLMEKGERLIGTGGGG